MHFGSIVNLFPGVTFIGPMMSVDGEITMYDSFHNGYLTNEQTQTEGRGQ